MGKHWTTSEVKLIENGFRVDEIVMITGRSKSSVRNFIYSNKYKLGNSIWNKSKKDKLRNLSKRMLTDKEIGLELGLSEKQISWARLEFGFVKKKKYTEDDFSFIKENIHASNLYLSIKLGRSQNAIKQIKTKLIKEMSK